MPLFFGCVLVAPVVAFLQHAEAVAAGVRCPAGSVLRAAFPGHERRALHRRVLSAEARWRAVIELNY